MTVQDGRDAGRARLRTLLQGAAVCLALGLAGGLGWTLGAHAAAHPHADAGLAQASPVDIGFAQFMAIHHDQAVLMSQIILDHGASGITELARRIQATQLLEIGQMRGWLALWGQAPLPASRSMEWMLAGRSPPGEELRRYLLDCKSAPDGMPGLATIDDLTRLRQQAGAERDQLFLQLMIRHHQGALPMARFAAANAQNPAVRKLAAQIVYGQTGELYQMTRLLALNQARADHHEADPAPLVAALPRPGSDMQFPCRPRRAIGGAFPGCKHEHLRHGGPQ